MQRFRCGTLPSVFKDRQEGSVVVQNKQGNKTRGDSRVGGERECRSYKESDFYSDPNQMPLLASK